MLPTQAPFDVRLILGRVDGRAVQLAGHARLKGPALAQGLVTRVDADDILGEAAGVGADGLAGRPGDRLEGRGEPGEDGRQQEQASDEVGEEEGRSCGRSAVVPVGHVMPFDGHGSGSGSDI
jgi:hypothetical protein